MLKIIIRSAFYCWFLHTLFNIDFEERYYSLLDLKTEIYICTTYVFMDPNKCLFLNLELNYINDLVNYLIPEILRCSDCFLETGGMQRERRMLGKFSYIIFIKLHNMKLHKKFQCCHFILGDFTAIGFPQFYNAFQKMSFLRLNAMDFFCRYALNVTLKTYRMKYALG